MMAARRTDVAPSLIGGTGDHAGQAETERHVIVYADHIGAQALIDRAGAGPGEASAVAGVGEAVIVGH